MQGCRKNIDSLKSNLKVQKIAVAIDCVIFGFDSNSKKLSVLLVRREVDPFKGLWKLIGDFPDSKTSMGKSANDILYKLTGLKDIYLSQLKTYGDVNRDPWERIISIVYYSLIRVDVLKNIYLEKYNAKWFEFNNLPELILDHREMVEDAIEKIRKKAKSEPLGFELLPKYFTLPQLQNLYECIYDTEFDSRNFRKKILSTGFLEKSNKKDKSSSKKGAYLYRFNLSNNLSDSKNEKYYNIKDVFQF